ncbi:MAG TPA: sugar-binding transcriptional regulator [Spirochaetia bacterium]|nr:sugar-binding transcriptional regulator [Spirochaetia bacterium]
MKTKFDTSLLVKVAQMYYNDDLKQNDIATALGISRSLISMILSEARDVGIVEITVRDPFLNNENLAKKIESRFGLRQCIVIPTSVRDDEALRKIVAQRAVELFNQIVRSKDVVGLAWGRTCYQFVTTYRAGSELRDISVVPLIGGSEQIAPYFQVNEMVRQFAVRLGGAPHFAHVPSFVSDANERDLFLNTSGMQAVRDRWARMDVALLGIGSRDGAHNTERQIYIGEQEIHKELDKLKVVGDLCTRYFTIDGKFIRSSYYDRVVGVDVEDLRRTKNVICVGAGTEKVEAILGALRTGILNNLITDEHTAKAVLSLDGTPTA